ncbi:DUF2971 domain-containing protein [Pantoea ananatis]|uniref:DUF2971 domain-containing protein n=1 Tax=Pantoea ananas TaxID=553 RepID=UPI003FA4CCEB
MTLYHYTDMNAVHSILNTHKIRMTDIRFLNDKTEYLQGLEILKEASHDALKEKLHYDDEYLKALSEWFEKAFKELFDFESASEIFYVASFSLSSDTLSQWRSYGMFAIGFDREKLAERVSEWAAQKRKGTRKTIKYEFIECYYIFDKDEALEKASELIRTKVIAELFEWWIPLSPIEHNMHIYRDLREVISMLATTFKHASFSEEEEVRLVIRDKIVSDKISFRTKNNILIPYYELDVSPDVISGVKIGPVEDQKITEQSLYIYNLHRATKLGDDTYLLDIETSDIPYRTL